MATEKQINYALYLLQRAGYPTTTMQSAHKALGARMGERDGRPVRQWLAGLDRSRISELIDELKARLDKQA